MSHNIPALPITWSFILCIFFGGIIGVISVATSTPAQMSGFTLTYYNQCATPTRTPTDLPPGYPTPTPRPTLANITPPVSSYPVFTPLISLRYPSNYATLTNVQTIHFADYPSQGSVEVVFEKATFDEYFIQQCTARVCPLNGDLSDGYYDWYVRVCQSGRCQRITDIWHFTIKS